MVDNVQYHIRLPLLEAILNRRQVRRGIEKCRVLFAHDHRRLESLEK
jgi:hypothetical protein